MRPGDALPSISKEVTQEAIRAYAEASGDFNPLHLDPEFAVTTHFGRPVAHGMLVLAYIGEMMALAFGKSWPESGRLKVRFRSPVYPGDRVSTFGEVLRVVEESDGQLRLECYVGCRNEGGEEVINGEASVTMTRENRGDVASD
ncbi:MAG: MaoC domain protein dehydratase [Dehalococcoidia bacterium]|nr:MaoC domain protein dehydratase [Dehalococcoidia bacterium]